MLDAKHFKSVWFFVQPSSFEAYWNLNRSNILIEIGRISLPCNFKADNLYLYRSENKVAKLQVKFRNSTFRRSYNRPTHMNAALALMTEASADDQADSFSILLPHSLHLFPSPTLAQSG